MGRPKYTKADKNQAEIVADLRRLGFDVDIICDLPGKYDLVVCGRKCMHNEDYLYIHVPACVRVEVKSENGLMNDTEIKYYELQRHPHSYIVAYSTEDILEWFGQE